jgi:hypothetical protein
MHLSYRPCLVNAGLVSAANTHRILATQPLHARSCRHGPTAASDPRSGAPLGCKVLVSVAYLQGAELDGRERWESVILNVAET